MFNRFSKRIVEHCCKEKDSNEIELYTFGINQGLNMLLNIVTALFVGDYSERFFKHSCLCFPIFR